MKNLTHSISRMMAMFAVAGVLFSSVMVGEAMAQTCNVAANGCTAGLGTSTTCGPFSNGSCGVCSNGQCVAAPELSDYMAMALVAVSAGTVLYLRRRMRAAA